MPMLIAAFVGGLAQVAASLAGRVLLALGISFVTFEGIDTVLTYAEGLIRTNIGGLTAEAASFLAFCGVDKALTMIFSATTAAVAIRGITGGALTKMVTKKA